MKSLSERSTPTSSLDFAPSLGNLDRKQCEAVLTRNVVGRLAFSLHDRVSIVPVHFVYSEGWIYGRTSPGGKLLDIVRNRRVAFEVDEDEGFFSWRSVVVHGSLYLVDPDRSAGERQAYAIALEHLRRVLPTSLGDADPVPFRTQLFRIQVTEISGRSSSLGGKKIPPTASNTTDYQSNPAQDATISAAVRAAIAEACAQPGRIHVDVFDEIVALSGNVETPGEKSAIERAVLDLSDVRAVVQQVETVFPSHQQKSPPELARDALRELRGDSTIANADVKLVVEHDWLRAEGSAETRASKVEVLRRLRGVRGVRGVIDRIVVPG